jgi:small ligand-binding sensory domain FIST
MPSGLGIAFCGERVSVTSVVLQENIYEPAQVKKCLQGLHNPVFPRPTNTSSLCFMFACMGRGQAFYDGQENVESKAFSELYPGVPLFGFFGGGEIGYDFPQSWTTLPKFRHSYTSIFVMVSLT